MATFITSKGIGETITISVGTSTGYWKYNHDGTDSSVFGAFAPDGFQSIEVLNANGEFTIISCLSDGTPSGDITYLYLVNNQLTSFDGTGLSALTTLDLSNNQLTSFDGTDLTALTYLNLADNSLTSFTGTGLSALTNLFLGNNDIYSFDGTGLSALTALDLGENWLTSFDGTDLTSLGYLNLPSNQLNSINITDLNSLRYFYTIGFQNQINTALVNDTILAKLAANQLENGWTEGDQSTFVTAGGRTAAGTADYDYLIANSWYIEGADLPVVGNGKLRVKGVGQL
jgi:Leucine-rich repeat (LRR) protein